MIGLPASVRILLFTAPTDMRKGLDGLSGLVSSAGHDLYSGNLFAFISRQAQRYIATRRCGVMAMSAFKSSGCPVIIKGECITNRRAKLVYSPTLVDRLAGHWDGSQQSREIAEGLAREE